MENGSRISHILVVLFWDLVSELRFNFSVIFLVNFLK